MPTSKHLPLSRAEQKFWQSAFLAAELSVLLKRDGHPLEPTGAAHLAAEYADAAVVEYRRAKHGATS